MDKNADPADEIAPPPPPPTGSFGTPSAMPSKPSANTPSVNFTPSPVGFVTPNQFNQPKRTSSTLSATSNYSTGSSIAVENVHENSSTPQASETPIVLSEPSAQSMSRRGRGSLKQRKQPAKAQSDEQDKKPAAPPSMFSLKAQGGRRGMIFQNHMFLIKFHEYNIKNQI